MHFCEQTSAREVDQGHSRAGNTCVGCTGANPPEISRTWSDDKHCMATAWSATKQWPRQPVATWPIFISADCHLVGHAGYNGTCGGDGGWPSGRFTDGKSNVQTRRVRLRADLIYDDTLTHQCWCGAGHLTEEEFSTLKESLLKGGLDPVRILAGRRR